jgi:hypothetical protein
MGNMSSSAPAVINTKKPRQMVLETVIRMGKPAIGSNPGASLYFHEMGRLTRGF